jgi:hypothetical protein
MLETNDEEAVLKGAYFNPLFANKLKQKVPEMAEAGIDLQQTSVESSQGQIVQAFLRASNGTTLDLGQVTLNGKDVSVTGNLATIDTVINFMLQNAKQTA